MKVIFLDIDGVLNYATTAARAPCGCIGIAEPAVRNLKKIIDATGAKIVLTSTWKSEWNIDADKCTPDDYQEQGIIPRLVQTSFMKGGLLDLHVQQAIDLLKENNDA